MHMNRKSAEKMEEKDTWIMCKYLRGLGRQEKRGFWGKKSNFHSASSSSSSSCITIQTIRFTLHPIHESQDRIICMIVSSNIFDPILRPKTHLHRWLAVDIHLLCMTIHVFPRPLLYIPSCFSSICLSSQLCIRWAEWPHPMLFHFFLSVF